MSTRQLFVVIALMSASSVRAGQEGDNTGGGTRSERAWAGIIRRLPIYAPLSNGPPDRPEARPGIHTQPGYLKTKGLQ
jgi:hypothetical protein